MKETPLSLPYGIGGVFVLIKSTPSSTSGI